MSIHVALNHVTHYRYDRAVKLGPQVVRLRPAPHCRSRILSYSLKVEPAGHFVNWQQDPQANYLARLVFPEAARELRIEVDLVVEMAVHNPFDFFLEPSAEKLPFVYDPTLEHELAPYRQTLPTTPLFQAYLDSISRQPRATADFLVDLNRRLSQDISYLIRLEP
ncbi:MAG TPA: transglutaminase N-terminal domain-containing protein, partial [Xanthomonadales bacterium]|nr:transglutaminase N-terminal domain-containing protein [Xanthomonadales bacterium]